MNDLYREHAHLVENGLLDFGQPTQFAHEQWRRKWLKKMGAPFTALERARLRTLLTKATDDE